MEHIENIKARGQAAPAPVVPGKRIVPREEPEPLKQMKQILNYMQVPFVTEHKFLSDRKFRFDIALPDKMIAVEYEGLFANKSRHVTVTGYSNDTEKYNLAVIAGWRVLRYTQLTYNRFLSDINQIMNNAEY